MLVSYHGPHPRVAVPLPTGGEVLCDRGGTCEIPDDHAKRLLEQSTWKPGKAAKVDAGAAKKDGAE